MSYTKVFSTMLDASIWREPNHVRIVWLTMLMMASKEGMVHASRLGLADRARVTPEEVDDALKVLGSADHDDKSGVQSGIRVIQMQGCWQLVNFEFYRECKSIDAVRKAQWRAKKGFQCFEETPKVSETWTPAPAPAPETPLGVPLALTSPTPKRETKARKTPLPDKFQPSGSVLKLAAKHRVDLHAEWPQFCDHHRKYDTRYADWDAAARTWVRNARKFADRKGPR